MPDTIVLGMGNPILGDDGAGYRVAELLRDRFSGSCGPEVIPTSCDWICILDRLDGFRRLVVVDTVSTGSHPPGTLRALSPAELRSNSPLYSIHHLSVIEALELGGSMGLSMPTEILFYAIEIDPPEGFTRSLSPRLSERIEQIADEIAVRVTERPPPGGSPFPGEEDHAREDQPEHEPPDPSGQADRPGGVRQEAG
ncbi:MAG: hydrogenase maturation protease [Candidatus Fermentibacteraceae bacterium]